MSTPSDLDSRIRALIDVGIGLTSELSLDGVLQKIVEAAADLTGARYAALGVIDRERRGLERFLTTGMDAETYAAIGELPRGLGILGVLIDDARALRLPSIGEHPSRSASRQTIRRCTRFSAFRFCFAVSPTATST